MQQDKFSLTSPVFEEGETIPEKYTCKDQNVSPPLSISGVPEQAVGLALVMHDPDAPVGDFLHWTIWSLDTNLTGLDENAPPDIAREGANDMGSTGYVGPCPPSGQHRYIFDLYALKAPLEPESGASREAVEEAIDLHKLEHTSLTGLCSA